MCLTHFERDELFSERDPNQFICDYLNEHKPSEATTLFTDAGGWPDEESFEVEDVELDGDSYFARCSVDFVENIYTGCEEHPLREGRAGEFVIRFDRDRTVAVVGRADEV